jgi:hypothetical protein
MTASGCPALESRREPRPAGDPARAGGTGPPPPAAAPGRGQKLTFHPNISFRGPQVLRVRTREASTRHRRCRTASSMLTQSITSAASTSNDTVPTQ